MSEFVDRVKGIYHFLADRTPRNVRNVPPRPPASNPWQQGGSSLLAKVQAGKDLTSSLTEAISLLGTLSQVISSGDRVMVKPNFNSPDPFPASTDLGFLRAVIELLLDHGAKVIIGESSGGVWRPTSNVFAKTGLDALAGDLGVELISFEDRPADWVRIGIEGEYLKELTMPRSAYEADRLVYLPCMKTHRLAAFSGALKLAFGFVHPGERRGFHMGNLQQKLAEVNLCWQPDLVIMDGRRAFVTGGPDRGKTAAPGLLLVSADSLAVDIEAVRILLSYDADNKLTAVPQELDQIAAALKLGLGNAGRYQVVA